MRVTSAILVLTVVILLAPMCMPASSSGNGDGGVGNPEMILGTSDTPYIAVFNSYIPITVGINKNAFRDHSTVCIEVGYVENGSFVSYGFIKDTQGPHIIACEDGNTAAYSRGNNDETIGAYCLSFHLGQSDGEWRYVIRVTVEDWEIVDGVDQAHVSQQYHFCAYIRAVESFNDGIYLSENPSQYVPLGEQGIQIGFDEDMTALYAYVNTGGTYIRDAYDFYAVGLPDGIGMKLDGSISGKLAESLMDGDSTKNFTIYAIGETDVNTIEKTNFTCQFMFPEDFFKYSVGSNTWNCTQRGHCAIANGDDLVIHVQAEDVNEVYAEYGNDDTRVDGISGTIIIEASALKNLSGIFQVHIMNGSCSATLHVMEVGPLVHSGLSPAVTSS